MKGLDFDVVAILFTVVTCFSLFLSFACRVVVAVEMLLLQPEQADRCYHG